MNDDNIYYVYAWYLKSTNHIFHIGKGKNNRMYDIKNHRNDYFKNKLISHGDDCAVKKLYENLSESEALDLERKLIKEYKEKGQCETNLHEGGCGGNTGKYDIVGEKVKKWRKEHPLSEKQKEVVKKNGR